jgi:hypothetical protein
VLPEELHQELIQAAKQWRDDERVGRTEIREMPAGFRVVWLDTGSGPGFEVLVPQED